MVIFLGAGQFCGIKLLNGNYFVYDVLYHYEQKETKCYGLQKYDTIYARDEDTITELENSFVPVHTVCKYMGTLVALNGFELVEDSKEELL